MQYNHILIRFGELTTKGKNKKDFINRLYHNTKDALSSFEKLTYQKQYDRMFIVLNGEDHAAVSEQLRHVFGIRSFSVALEVASDADAILAGALFLMKQKSDQHTFKVNARRNDKTFPIHSDELNRKVAGEVLRNTELKVAIHRPDVELKIEVRKEYTYLMTDVILGAGGYPVGVGGKALLMLSGGIDSPVAGYLTMKRGIQLECIHYASPPYTSEQAQQKVLDLANVLARFQGKMKVHIVPFTDLQLAIYNNANESYAITIMRRMMYRIAEKIAAERNCLAIVNGESVGQVASQTLESMGVINAVTTLPVLRPVVTYDKLEIIELAKKIQSYELSIQPFEDCCTIFTPRNPITKPSLRKVQLNEQFDFEPLIEECVRNTKSVWLLPNKKEADLF